MNKTFLIVVAISFAALSSSAQKTNSYNALVQLLNKWRSFEQPPLRNGAPDYTQTSFAKRRAAFQQLRVDLKNIDTSKWSITQQNDWMILWAEMNGYDFNERILKPWQRDPAFYKTVWTERSDVPAHEGPTHHAVLEVWQYQFPLIAEKRNKFLKELKVIPSLNEQAKINLTGNARDLWVTGIRDIETQVTDLNDIKQLPGIGADEEIIKAIDAAIASTKQLVTWLQKEAVKKNGPSGIGKENYTWYQKNVHLVPLTWDEEVTLLKRELTRAWTSLQQEEHRNRLLPPLQEAENEAAYQQLADNAAKSLIDFLQSKDIVTVKPYFDKALREHLGNFVPKERRNFFYITSHLDPRPLFSHFYHWFELARMDNEPHNSELRRSPLLYNIFDSRNEGLATAVEEWFMNAGLYDNSPRSREIVYILIAQRVARGLGSLYAHANMMTMSEAGSIHNEYTPRGWMKTEKELQIFEQHLYLRQPGYGTSYITGKHLLETAMAEYARQREAAQQPFVLKTFMDRLNEIGCIPVSLCTKELLGKGDVLLIK
jgi:hypothetical protein